MKNIMCDGKIDEYDVPEIALMLVDIINTQPTLKLTVDDFPIFVELLFDHIVKEYNLLDATSASGATFKRLLDSSIKLLLMQPKIRKGCESCFGKLSGWCR